MPAGQSLSRGELIGARIYDTLAEAFAALPQHMTFRR